MIYFSTKVPLRNGHTAILRSAEPEDAARLIEYLRITSGETPFLLRDPDEIQLTTDDEIRLINSRKEAERDLMLIAEVNGEHAGCASCVSMGPYRRYRHRCDVAIALYQKFWGLGLGKIMLGTVLETAKKSGYEQAELQVVSTNTAAIALYKSLGFEINGTLIHSMKYADGSYADEYQMRKNLKGSD